MFYVYVLCSQSSGKLYIGQTGDIKRRLKEHQTGLARYTHGKGPWELMFAEEYQTRSEAMARERFLKTGRGRVWLKEKINGRAGSPKAN
jgi:putative endonuclease